MVSLANFSY